MARLRSTSIFKLVLAISIGVLVFIIIQMSYLPGMDQKDQGSQVLEQRLIHLESDLSKSRHVVDELHQAVRQLITVPTLASDSGAGHGRGQPAAGPQPQQQSPERADGPPDGAVGQLAGPPQARAAWQRRQTVGLEATKQAVGAALCEFGRQPPKTTDIKMLDMYQEMSFENKNGGVWKQGWDIGYDPKQWDVHKKLKVFVVPHSHNDPGWLKTFEQYYSSQTRNIFDAMVDALERHPRMKFIWAEISYLDLWWSEITPHTKDRVRRLVSKGQLELVTAGWVMHDEANSHYLAILEQLVTGHEWLRLNLNATVSTGWAIDPFGLSPTTAYLLRRSGLDHMVIQRAHYAVKRQLARHKQLEFWWRQAWDGGNSTDMFCHLMPFYSYDAPHSCGPDPKVCCQYDFARLPNGKYKCPWRIAPTPITLKNVNERAETLLDQYRKKAQLYNSDVLMVPLGDDFRYDSPHEWDAQYVNYQALFDHMNAQTDWHVEAQFGTLSDYFAALKSDARQRLPTGIGSFPRLSGDFFTYADKNDEYWSGYFTSRPFFKNMDRVLIGQLRAAEVLYSLTLASLGGSPSAEVRSHTALLMADLVVARRALSLFQHHDAITGTAKDRVVADYSNKLLTALRRCERVMQQSAHLLLLADPAGWTPDLSAQHYQLSERWRSPSGLPQPATVLLAESPRAVVLYNSLARPRAELVTLHVSAAHVQVTDADGRVVPSQCAPVFDGVAALVADTHKLQFVAALPPLSLTTFTVKEVQPEMNSAHSLAEVSLVHVPGGRRLPVEDMAPYTVQYAAPAVVTLRSAHLQLQLGPDGLMTSLALAGEPEVAVSLDFVTYGVRPGTDQSGAYIFTPSGPARPAGRQVSPYRLERGRLVSAVAVQLPEVLHQLQMVSAEGADDGAWVQIHNVVDVSRRRDFELAMRLTSGINSGDRFVTDLNGFQTIERRTFSKLPIQGNYYPVPGMIYVEDSSRRLTLTLGQPLGGASLSPGQVEVMLDRRLMRDDNRGVGQGVTDNRPTASAFRLLLERSDGRPPPTKPLPSLLAGRAQRAQLHPVYPLVDMAEPSPRRGRQQQPGAGPTSARARWSAAAQPAACDVELVGLRTMVGGADGGDVFRPAQTALLTVHRRPADCRYSRPAPPPCTGTPGKLLLSHLLPDGAFESEATQVSLTGFHRGRRVALASPLALDDMEMYAFLVKRR